MTNKRKLNQLVDAGHVSGCDVARMSTLPGYRLRGYTLESTRKFSERRRVNRASGVVGIREHGVSISNGCRGTARRAMW
ncbi:glutamate--tRNA ligase family protein, partial [Pseudomonas aeruginosa]|uniref:glutamate--tRNA ligase family protein n=1 Tax=Pseudomonas aeruginosa TaxID=287 RepID=UPI003D807152